jgi:hypothetical protein
MSVPIIVATYAAVVASAALGWQVFIWRVARRNRVSVTLIMGLAQVAERRYGPAIYVVVRNFGPHPIRTVAAGLHVSLKDGTSRVIHASVGALLTAKVEPNDAASVRLLRDDLELEGVNFDQAMVGWVDLATGERAKSPRLTLIPRPVDERGYFLPESF